MGLFGLTKTPERAAVIIDVSSGSVGGAYVGEAKGKPSLNFSARVPIRPHNDEELSAAMLRALAELCEHLIVRGAPVQRRVVGSAQVHEVLVSISAPWQECSVRTERVEQKGPFVITKSLVSEVVSKSTVHIPGRVNTGESILATVLNGYDTSAPFGHKAKLADFIILSSSVPEAVKEGIEAVLARAYHSRSVRLMAYAPSMLSVFRDTYPHEKHYLLFDVAAGATEIAFVHQGRLASLVATADGVGTLVRQHAPTAGGDAERRDGVVVHKDEKNALGEAARTAWIAHIVDALKLLGNSVALPRTLFLVADDDAREYVRRALDDPALRRMWLSDEPLTIIPITPAQFTPFVVVGAEAQPDVVLMMLALFHAKPVDAIGA